jgi:hypothetical protein
MLAKAIAPLALLVLAVAGCTENVKATVNCKTTATTAECEVKQTEGKAAVEVCWDFSVTCHNGTKIESLKNCAKVSGGGTTHHTITADRLKGTEKCDASPVAKVANLTLNGKPGT